MCAEIDDNQPLLQVCGLAMSWDGMPVCEDVAFDVRRGELVCLVGRSGSGKSTIFHAIAGLATPDAGEILLAGEDVVGRPGKVSYMLQKDLLLEQHTIVDNVAMPLFVRGVPRPEAREAASSRFAEFGLAGFERSYPSQLSGGMRQRAALLRTCLMDNDIVLMDEPFSALDAFTRSDMRAWFLEMLTRLRMSSLLVTHDVDEAVAMADRVLVLAGEPASGRPSSIAGEVTVPCARTEREDFILSGEALAVKKEVLTLLQ